MRKDGMEQMARNRYRPFGYRMENGEIIIHEKEAICVRSAYLAYLDGNGYATIAESLQGTGVRYHEDTPLWNKHMVKRMLENERYTGKDGYPIIIQKELFERAFMIRKSKAVKTERKEKPQDKLPCITPAETRNFPTDIRVARLENQINWELSRSILEPERLKTKIFQCAVMKYDALRIHVNKKPNKTLDTDNADFDI